MGLLRRAACGLCLALMVPVALLIAIGIGQEGFQLGMGHAFGLVDVKTAFDRKLDLMGGRLPFLPHWFQQLVLSLVWTDARNIALGCGIFGWQPPAKCAALDVEHWSAEELRAALPEFAALYRHRPIAHNMWGMNTNHAFALWFTVRAVRPTHIIESGVLRGFGTWLLRHAAGPEAQIFSFDPMWEGALSWRDNSTRARYFMGDKFTDCCGKTDWTELIPPSQRATTLVVLDDHTSAITRVRQLKALGFRHLWFDDNSVKGADFYTMAAMCSLVEADAREVVYKEDLEHNETHISAAEHQANVDYILGNVETYFEFPPVYDGCGWARPPLVADKEELPRLGLPGLHEDIYHYRHMHPPYVKLRS